MQAEAKLSTASFRNWSKLLTKPCMSPSLSWCIVLDSLNDSGLDFRGSGEQQGSRFHAFMVFKAKWLSRHKIKSLRTKKFL